jgi:hypothetical protein
MLDDDSILYSPERTKRRSTSASAEDERPQRKKCKISQKTKDEKVNIGSMFNTYYSMSHVVDVCAPVNAIERAPAAAAKELVVVEVAVVAVAEAAAAAAAAEQRPALARETRTSSKGGKIRFCG